MADTAHASSASTASVLVVEDSDETRATLELALASWGYPHVAVAHARAAIDAFEERSFDVVLTDVRMPGMSGIELTAWLRAHHPTTPAIVMTAFGSVEGAAAALRAGAVDLLVKPFAEIEIVRASIERALDHKRLEDTLQRKASELEESRASFASLVDASPIGMLVVTKAGRVRFANRAAAAFAGKPIADLVGAPAPWTIAAGTPVEIEVRLPSGARGVVEARLDPTQWAGEEAAVIRIRDVTARVQAEAALRESELRFRQLAETVPEVFWLAAYPTGETLYLSPAYVEVWGQTRESFYEDPRSALEAIHPDDRSRIVQASEAGIEAGFEQTFRLLRGDGSVRWIRSRLFPVHEAAGGVDRVVGLAIDITEQTTLQSQLLHAQKMDAIGRLAAGVAHDFNNVLTAILGYSELLLPQFREPDPARGDLIQIQAAGNRAAALARQLLALGRNQTLSPRPVNLNELVTSMDRLLERVIGEHILLETLLDPDLGTLVADPTQLEQVILNLAVNARDAMPDGGTLTIRTLNHETDRSFTLRHDLVKAGRYVMLVVTDTGTGIPEDAIDRIFEPFFTTKQAGKGTGLGLSTVYGIVKQSGGHISVYNGPGAGATFKVSFPHVVGAAASTAPAAPVSEEASGSETVLLVEDDDLVRALAHRALLAHGYQVLEARNAGEALLISQRRGIAIDLLLTDVVMPQVSGPELAEHLRPLRPDMKVLFMSGYAEFPSEAQATQLTPENLVSKPFTPTALARRVREALDRA